MSECERARNAKATTSRDPCVRALSPSRWRCPLSHNIPDSGALARRRVMEGRERGVDVVERPVRLVGRTAEVEHREHAHHERAVRALVAVRRGVVVYPLVREGRILKLVEQGLAEAVRLAEVEGAKVLKRTNQSKDRAQLR